VIVRTPVTDTTLRHCLTAHLERYRTCGGGVTQSRPCSDWRRERWEAAASTELASATWMDGGGDVGDVVGEEGLGGGAAFTVVGVVGGALKAGLPGEDAERGHEDGAERAGGFQRVLVLVWGGGWDPSLHFPQWRRAPCLHQP